MNKKRISMLLAGLMMFSNATSAFAMSNEVHKQIQGNSLLIGNYLFELDKNANSFNLNSFITSARSIADGQENEVYYKDASGNWYELVEDGSMKSVVAIDKINNAITMRNGVAENTDPNVLAKSDLLVSPATIVESTATPGTFDTEVTVTIKSSNNAKFAANVGATVDSISSASLVRTAPAGTNMQITRVDDKNIKLKLTGTASNHAPSVNKTEGSADNQKDFNKNGTYGDIKFLMLPTFFTGVNTVAEGGQYVVLDVQFNDGAVEDRIINAGKSTMLTIENVDYGVLVLNKGNIDTYNFTLNGAVLNPTKVNDSGTVVKFEMNRKQVAKVKLVSKTDVAKTDTVTIGSGTEAFTTVVKDQDPDRVLVSGPVTYFDYHLVDYDKDGIVRSTLEKTTFDTENEGVTPVDKTVPKLTLEKERTPLGENIVINVAEPSSVMSKKWMANIYEVLKDYNKSASSRVPLQFTVDQAAGKITILANSSAISDRNGHHDVLIKSNSFNDVKVKFELVEPAGKIYLSSNYNWIAHNDLLFELKDFNYAVTNPVHSVYLDGKKLVDIDDNADKPDYVVISNLVRLENNTLNMLTVGKHELVVKINGFEDFKREFTLRQAANNEKNPTFGSKEEKESAMLTVDAVSAASGALGAAISSDGSSSGGGIGIRANVVFDFDHISNAFILRGLGMETPYVTKTIKWWASFKKDALIKNNSEVLMSYEFYKNHVGINGEYETFAEAKATLPSINPPSSETIVPGYDSGGVYLNRPYNVKNMLHDGELGDVYSFGQLTSLSAPSLSVRGGQVLYGQDVVVEYSGDSTDTINKWAESLISVKENAVYMKFDVDKNNKTITFKADKNKFLTGDNNFVFKAEGFKTSTLKVTIYKADQSGITIKKNDANDVIAGDFSSDFIQNLRSVSVGGKVLLNDSQVGSGKGQYEVVGNQIIIRKSLFGSEDDQLPLDKQVTLLVTAEDYSDYTKNFTLNALSGGVVEDQDVPNYVQLDDGNTYNTYQDVSIVVEEVTNKNYKNKIQNIYLNGKKLNSSQYNYNFYNLVIHGDVFTEAKSYTLKIEVDGYKDFVENITINEVILNLPKDVKLINNDAVIDGDTLNLRKMPSTVKIQVTPEYQVALNRASSKILLDGNELSNDKYQIAQETIQSQNLLVLTIDTASMSNQKFNVTLNATGYNSKVYNVVVTPVVTKAVPSSVGLKSYSGPVNELELSNPKDVEISTDKGDYFAAIKEIQIVNNSGTVNKTKDELLSYGRLGLKGDLLKTGENNITIKATGYDDYVCKITIPLKDVPSSLGIFDGSSGVVDGNEVTYATTQAATIIIGSSWSSSPGKYKDAISSIKVNDNIVSDSISYDKDDTIGFTIPALYFESGKRNRVMIEATDYKPVEFFITIQ
jgi:hypothetical protein